MDNNVAVSGNFEIIPCDKMTDIENKPGIKKLELTSSQKSDWRTNATASCSRGG